MTRYTYTVRLSKVVTQRYEAELQVTVEAKDPAEAMEMASEQAELLAERGCDADGKELVSWSGDNCDGADSEVITAEEVEATEEVEE